MPEHCTSLDCELCDYEYCPNENRDSDGLEDFEFVKVEN